MFKKLKDKKGFTLVELIVVLVILAILAALLVPALTGYIDKAKDESVIAETRMAVMATQTLIDEQYGKLKSDVAVSAVAIGDDDATTGFKDGTFTIKQADINKLSETKGKVSDVTINATGTANEAIARITQLKYTSAGKVCTYNGTDYSVANAPKDSKTVAGN